MLGVATAAKLNPNSEMSHRLDQIEALNAPAIRTSINWRTCEPVAGSGDFVWTKSDTLLGGIGERGIKVCLTLQGRLDGHALDPDQVTGYGAFVRAAAERYHDPALILGYENQNEVMLGTKYDTNPTPERYVPMQRVFYEACKASSDLPVGTSAIIGNINWLAECYAAGIKGTFDFATFHPYTCHGTPSMSPSESMHAQRGGWWAMQHVGHQTMRDNGEGHKTIWATEFGSNAGGGREDRGEKVQAADLADAAHRFANNPHLEHLFWFDGWDTLPQTKDQGDWMGLYRADGTEKLAAQTFRDLVAA